MELSDFLLQAFIYLGAAVIAVPLAKRFGLGSVLGYLIAGIAIGPFGLHLVGEEGEDVLHFAEFGVVMMLFVVGLELEPALLWRLRGPILGLGGLQVAITTLLGFGAGLAFGLAWQEALAIGLIIALSSTAIVLQSLNERGLLKTEGGQSSFAVLLFQDIAVIPMLAIFPLLATHSGDHSAEAGHAEAVTLVGSLPPWAQTLAVLAAVALIIVGGRYLVRPAFRIIGSARLREVFTAAALLLVIGIALLMNQVGLSAALGTFLAGVVLANSEYRHELESDIEPFKGLLLGLFFIAVGASIDFRLIMSQPLLIFGLVIGIMLLKLGVLFVLARAFRLSLDQGLLFAFSLPQVGEFAFVLLSFANQEGVLLPAVSGPLVAAVALSMALTPPLMIFSERVLMPRFGTRERVNRPADQVEERNRVIIAGFGSFGSTVGRILRANGVATTVLDHDSDRVDALRRLGMAVYYGDALRHDLLEAAGANEAKALVIALDSPERSRELVELAHKHFPHLQIFARAFEWNDLLELRALGIEHVYREAVDGSLGLCVDLLRTLGFRAHQATRAVQTFRRHEAESARLLTEARGDQGLFVSAVRQRIAQLESLMRADREAPDLNRDSGWDVDSLRTDMLQRFPQKSTSD